MALSDIDEAREFDLRMAQMQADIDLKTIQAKKVQQDWRLDPQRIIIQAMIATAAVVGAIVSLVAGTLGFFIGRSH